jgi:hemolysin-activating ACP:hemolysin acyltransferase
MKNFLAVYTGSPSSRQSWERLDEQERKRREAQGMKAWGDWMSTHQAAIVDSGAPLGKTKRVAADGVTDIRNNLGAYVVVRAESYEAAARMFEKHPHFTIFPGDAVEIMECLPIPGTPQR